MMQVQHHESPSIVPDREWPSSCNPLLERIYNLEEELGMKTELPPEFNIPKNMSALLSMLLKREIITRQGALLAIYSGMPNAWDQEPDPKIIDVFICKLRVRLRKYGIKISCKWGFGYFIDNENKRKFRELAAQLRAVEG